MTKNNFPWEEKNENCWYNWLEQDLQGLGIAKRLAIAGEDVIVWDLVKKKKALTVVGEANEEIKEHNPKELVGMANEDAAAAADVLILTVPLQAQSATLKTIKEKKGKVLFRCNCTIETAIGGPVSPSLHINRVQQQKGRQKILKRCRC